MHMPCADAQNSLPLATTTTAKPVIIRRHSRTPNAACLPLHRCFLNHTPPRRPPALGNLAATWPSRSA